MRTRNARGIKCPLLTRTAHMRLYAANFRSANFSSLNAHFRVTDYPANEEVSRRKRKQRAIGPDVTVVMLGATVRLLQLLF